MGVNLAYSPAIMRRIVEQSAASHGIDVARMLTRTYGPRRDRVAHEARVEAARLARERGYSLYAIGQGLGGRDHSTVRNALGLCA